ARVLQAVGAALLTPASLSIVIAAFPQSKRALTVSLWGAVGGFAAAVGPSLGSFVIETVGWPWAFFINLPVGAFFLWRGADLLPESAPSPGPRRGGAVRICCLSRRPRRCVAASTAWAWRCSSSPSGPLHSPSSKQNRQRGLAL